jgi:hypothetical protein
VWDLFLGGSGSHEIVVVVVVVRQKTKTKKVADYAAQAVINTILSHAFPDDPIVGEEDAAELRAPTREGEGLCARVVELADDVLAQPPFSPPPTSASSFLGGGERAEWGLGRRWGAEALLNAIDRGNYAGGRSGRAYFFVCLSIIIIIIIIICSSIHPFIHFFMLRARPFAHNSSSVCVLCILALRAMD